MRANDFLINLKGEELFLLPERAIFWKGKNILLLSDLHLGKSGHFRKAGIPVSSKIHDDDLIRLSKIIEAFPVRKIYLLGDLFHSVHNREWNEFSSWRKGNPAIEVHLIKGNHDIIADQLLVEAEILLHASLLDESPFVFTHKIIGDKKISGYQITGHIHPAVHIKGKGRQTATLPCFFFAEKFCVLPAFGNFTGNAIIRPEENDHVFMILGEKVIPMRKYDFEKEISGN